MKIKTCPFCGGQSRHRQAANALHWIQCAACGVATKLYDTIEAAYAAWNRRQDSREEAFVAFLEREGKL